MSRDASIDLDWAGESRRFRLAWGELIQLQEERDAGPALILKRLFDGSWRVQDIASVIRLGLVGGGIDAAKAAALIRSHVEARPPVETLALAQGILALALSGPPDEKLGEAGAAQETPATV